MMRAAFCVAGPAHAKVRHANSGGKSPIDEKGRNRAAIEIAKKAR
jgi:hypothetical protein